MNQILEVKIKTCCIFVPCLYICILSFWWLYHQTLLKMSSAIDVRNLLVSKWIVVSLKIVIFANVLLVLKSFLQQMFCLIVLNIYITLFNSSTSPHMVLVEFDNVIFIRVNRVICRRSTSAQIVCWTSMKLMFMLWIQRLILTVASNGVPNCSIFIPAIL
jgi:hypothetical protein